jgi:hypothetical protein
MESLVKVTASAKRMCMTNISYFRVSILCDAMAFLWCVRTCITSISCSDRWVGSLLRFQKCSPNPYLRANNVEKLVQGPRATLLDPVPLTKESTCANTDGKDSC